MSDTNQFAMAPAEFIIMNSSDEVLEPQYRGQTVVCPKSGEVVLPNSKHPEVFHSAKDANGEWIPGTVVVKDLLDGNTQQVDWAAREAVKHILNMELKTGRCTGGFYDRGLSYLPANPSSAQINKVYAEGRKRYEKSKYAQAKTVVDYYAELNEARKRWGAPPLPAGDDYIQAARLLNEASALQVPLSKATQEITDSLPQEPDIPITDEGLRAFARAKFEVLAAETAAELGDAASTAKDKIVEAMMEDGVSLGIVREQYKQQRKKNNKKSVRA